MVIFPENDHQPDKVQKIQRGKTLGFCICYLRVLIAAKALLTSP